MSQFRSAEQVRTEFLEFFEQRGHRVVPSSPVFPKDDPTLLFTNAGMNQFKDVFLGSGTRDYTRATDTQKCIRVSGKHNDLEEVGVDTYHHTFFEMLGNWSFGDYFKADAIKWAWELLTDVWKLPKERLWVTVFAGDEKDGLGPDEDAEKLWREHTDIDPARILRFDREDNFWEMGETGPCGPCSEIHLDRGTPDSDPADGALRDIGVNAGNERFIELWNLVFMQFNRMDDGRLVDLPAKSVDTGMGFERVLSVLQGKLSNYDTDLFRPLFDRIENVSGKSYGASDSQADIAFRVIADHARAVTAAISDGALPGNTGRNYVLRRLIRRASRYGRQALGIERPFLGQVARTVAEVLGTSFPEMRERIDHVELVMTREEEAFGRTLDRGLVQFENLANSVAAGAMLPGTEAFELYATYGFPRDLVELMARERELQLDADGWEAAERKHQETSRSEGTFKQLLSAEEMAGIPETESLYHSETEQAVADAVLLRLIEREDGRALAVLDRTPFYAESGGQVGDSGKIEASDGAFQVEVEDTQKVGGVVVHIGRLSGAASDGAQVHARVDDTRRASTRRNHTATHLLHKALREVLGEHVSQQGSYVGPDRLRFDLSHPKGLEPQELSRIEAIVNEHVIENAPVKSSVEDLESAKQRGAMALFGEKYGERVRVVQVGDWSTELCGGTHVAAAGDIGPFVIVSERAIQAGVRRIEALTGLAAVSQIQHERGVLSAASKALKVGADELPTRIESLQKQVKDAKKSKAAAAKADVAGAFEKVREQLTEVGDSMVGAIDLGIDQGALRELGSRVKAFAPNLAVALFGRAGDRVPFLIFVQGSAAERGLAAGDLAKRVSAYLGGGGGGKPDMAQGQGESATYLDAALAELRAVFAELA